MNQNIIKMRRTIIIKRTITQGLTLVIEKIQQIFPIRLISLTIIPYF